MKLVLRAAFTLALLTLAAQAQTSGNIAYEQGGNNARAQQFERSQRTFTTQDLPPTDTSMFVDASVLLNVKADEYVATFGLSQEAPTVQEAAHKMDATVQQFTASLKALHIRDTDIYVDFITEPKIYGYDITENVAREKIAGFELKKNVSIHYIDRDLIDKLIAAAAQAQIYDLIKVDYVVRDIPAIQQRLLAEASAIVKQKLADYQKLLAIKVVPPVTIYAQRSAIHYPTEMYDSYTAAESESLSRIPNQQKFTIERARRSRTMFFHPLDGNGFDKVINPSSSNPSSSSPSTSRSNTRPQSPDRPNTAHLSSPHFTRLTLRQPENPE